MSTVRARFAFMLSLVLTLLLVVTGYLLAQDSTMVADPPIVGVPEIPGSIGEFLTQYQLALSTVLGSLLVYGMAKLTAFSKAGDWTKRVAYLVAALLVSAVLKYFGGTLSADLAGAISTGMSGIMSAATGMAVYQMGKNQPSNRTD